MSIFLKFQLFAKKICKAQIETEKVNENNIQNYITSQI
jgi:hypothetical protein